MSTPFLGEIILFAGNFPPAGYAFCDGQVLAIRPYKDLYDLIGTRYGGDGRTTFALPNLQSRAPLHFGHGGGLFDYKLGATVGVESVTLQDVHLPPHSHTVTQSEASALSRSPQGNLLAQADHNLYTSGGPLTPMAAGTITPAGGGQPHENRQPYLALNFCIAITGVIPA